MTDRKYIEPRKNGDKSRGQFQPGNATRFKPGNPGRPKGSRNSTTLAAQALLHGEALAITRKCIELAKAGNLFAIKLILDRLIPVIRPELADLERRLAAMEQADGRLH